MDLVSKGKGGLFPFLLLCFIAATFGVANALVEGAMMGDLSCISGDLIQPFAAGLGVAGAITSGLSLFTKAVFQNSRDGLRKGASKPLYYLNYTTHFYMCDKSHNFFS